MLATVELTEAENTMVVGEGAAWAIDKRAQCPVRQKDKFCDYVWWLSIANNNNKIL